MQLKEVCEKADDLAKATEYGTALTLQINVFGELWIVKKHLLSFTPGGAVCQVWHVV